MMGRRLAFLGLVFFLCFGLGSGMVFAARYVINHDVTVTDTQTKLMWQQEDDGRGMPWDEASSNYCARQTTGGHSDWRVPRVDELRTIVDYTRWEPAVNPVFKGHASGYWTSSTRASYPYHAWFVQFFSGHVDTFDKDSNMYVRCVRKGPYWSFDPSDRLKVLSKHTVKDTFRGYVWQRFGDVRKREWQEAQTYCSNLDLDGYTDWRLPTIDELQTIVDYTVWDPALSIEAMYGSSYGYWTTSSYAYNPTLAWDVHFYDGDLDTNYKYYDLYVRCVRTGLATLTLSKSGTGNGKVISSPVGINCGSDCSEKFERGMKIKLVATADTGSVFSGWSGGGCAGFGTKPCTVTATRNTTITAQFNKISPDYIDDENESGTDYEH